MNIPRENYAKAKAHLHGHVLIDIYRKTNFTLKMFCIMHANKKVLNIQLFHKFERVEGNLPIGDNLECQENYSQYRNNK